MPWPSPLAHPPSTPPTWGKTPRRHRNRRGGFLLRTSLWRLQTLRQELGLMHGQKGVGRLCYQGRGPQFPKGWPGISGAWWGLTEDDGPCVVTELGLGRGVRGEQHIEEPEGGSWGEQQPQQQQDPLPRGAGRPHSSPSAWCPVKRSWAGLIWSGGGRGPRPVGGTAWPMGLASGCRKGA